MKATSLDNFRKRGCGKQLLTGVLVNLLMIIGLQGFSQGNAQRVVTKHERNDTQQKAFRKMKSHGSVSFKKIRSLSYQQNGLPGESNKRFTADSAQQQTDTADSRLANAGQEKQPLLFEWTKDVFVAVFVVVLCSACFVIVFNWKKHPEATQLWARRVLFVILIAILAASNKYISALVDATVKAVAN